MIENLKPYPAYKDSGVEWLGQVPAHWEVRRLKHAAKVIMGQSPSSEDCKTESIAPPFLQGCAEFGALHPIPKQFCENPPKKAPVGAILISVRAPVGRINIANQVYGIGRGLCAIVPDIQAFDPSYARFLLSVSVHGLNLVSTGSTYDAVSVGDVGGQPVLLPSLPEQTAIVRFLDYVDRRIQRLIRARQKQIKLLEEYKQALIHQAVTGQIDVRTGQPYPEYKDSGVEWLGQVPAHWELLPLKFLSRRVQNGSTPPTSNESFYNNGTIPWYGPSSCGYEELVGKPVRLLNEIAFQAGVARLIKAPALLIVVIGATAGRMALLNQDGSTNQQITAYELKSKQVIPEFAIKQLRPAESWLRGNSSSATIPILNSNMVSRLEVALPPFPEQNAIVEYLDEQTGKIDRVIEAARREIELLKEFRTRLIADVVTGKLDVREAAANLPQEPEEPEPLDELEEEAQLEEDHADDLNEIPEEMES